MENKFIQTVALFMLSFFLVMYGLKFMKRDTDVERNKRIGLVLMILSTFILIMGAVSMYMYL